VRESAGWFYTVPAAEMKNSTGFVAGGVNADSLFSFVDYTQQADTIELCGDGTATATIHPDLQKP
jgi:hypothetical protein